MEVPQSVPQGTLGSGLNHQSLSHSQMRRLSSRVSHPSTSPVPTCEPFLQEDINVQRNSWSCKAVSIRAGTPRTHSPGQQAHPPSRGSRPGPSTSTSSLQKVTYAGSPCPARESPSAGLYIRPEAALTLSKGHFQNPV